MDNIPLLLLKCISFLDAVLAQNNCIHGIWEMGMPAHSQTQGKEVCVVDGDEVRDTKARKSLGRMSCDITHGRGLNACMPEGGLKSKSAHLWKKQQ